MLDFSSLYQRYAPDVYHFALYLSGDAAMAEDITAETFVRAWTAQDIKVATVRAYLFAIARNLYRQGLRVKRRETSLSPEWIDPAPDAESKLTEKEQRRWLLKQLRQLPELDRSALLMRTQHEMSYEEIAAALNVSTTAAKVRAHRAKLKLARQWLEENRGSNS